jgi:hypothetical protein
MKRSPQWRPLRRECEQVQEKGGSQAFSPAAHRRVAPSGERSAHLVVERIGAGLASEKAAVYESTP